MSILVFARSLGLAFAVSLVLIGLGIRAVVWRLFGRAARIPPFQSLLAAALTLSGVLICLTVPLASWLFAYGGCDYGLKQSAVCSGIPDGLGQAAFTYHLLLSSILVFLVPLALIAIAVVEIRSRRKPR